MFGAINRADLSAATLSWAGSGELDRLEGQLAVVDGRIHSYSVEVDRLAQLRDTLLSELLSGRVRAHEPIEVGA